jgi:urease accessory protein
MHAAKKPIGAEAVLKFADAACAACAEHPSPLLPLVRLLQLASPALPIGAYSYSQGLEWAVQANWVHDAASAKQWIGDVLSFVIARGDAPILARLLRTAGTDWRAFAQWNAWFRASRESAELRAESEQMGRSLLALMSDLGLLDTAASEILPTLQPITLPAAFALAVRAFEVPTVPALAAYVWSWLENQVMAAVKLVPLGQVAGQKLLVALGARIPAVVDAALAAADDDISTFGPGLALASASHETQYTRLFRS